MTDDAGSMRIGAAASALGVSIDTLRRWERDGRVTFERRGNMRYIAAGEVARLLRSRQVPTRSSARNHLDGVVIAIKKDGVMAQVELACGPYRIVSLMSREAADELGLEVGSTAQAVSKSTTVVIKPVYLRARLRGGPLAEPRVELRRRAVTSTITSAGRFARCAAAMIASGEGA